MQFANMICNVITDVYKNLTLAKVNMNGETIVSNPNQEDIIPAEIEIHLGQFDFNNIYIQNKDPSLGYGHRIEINMIIEDFVVLFDFDENYLNAHKNVFKDMHPHQAVMANGHLNINMNIGTTPIYENNKPIDAGVLRDLSVRVDIQYNGRTNIDIMNIPPESVDVMMNNWNHYLERISDIYEHMFIDTLKDKINWKLLVPFDGSYKEWIKKQDKIAKEK